MPCAIFGVPSWRDPYAGIDKATRQNLELQDQRNKELMLYNEASGQLSSLWYEVTGNGVMRFTDLDGTIYQAKRLR